MLTESNGEIEQVVVQGKSLPTESNRWTEQIVIQGKQLSNGIKKDYRDDCY